MLSYNPYGLIIELNMSNNVDYLKTILFPIKQCIYLPQA
ncbi:hypothetical protein LAC30SC_06945 [Lactobacillus amylovorus]|uniref:Uncharacterized protein n=1 Tax=Lactobacillus amylovorus TaxID=1604 RepID=F0TFL0_LACAM|nr:hypothetical protein LAC30SC_06945 [Lactobacillus amylovorus]